MWTDRNDFSHTYFNFVCSVCKTHRSAGKCQLVERLAVQNDGGFRWRSHQHRHFDTDDTDAAHTAAFKIDQASFYFQSNNRHIQRTFIFLSCIRSVLKYLCILETRSTWRIIFDNRSLNEWNKTCIFYFMASERILIQMKSKWVFRTSINFIDIRSRIKNWRMRKKSYEWLCQILLLSFRYRDEIKHCCKNKHPASEHKQKGR